MALFLNLKVVLSLFFNSIILRFFVAPGITPGSLTHARQVPLYTTSLRQPTRSTQATSVSAASPLFSPVPPPSCPSAMACRTSQLPSPTNISQMFQTAKYYAEPGDPERPTRLLLPQRSHSGAAHRQKSKDRNPGQGAKPGMRRQRAAGEKAGDPRSPVGRLLRREQ